MFCASALVTSLLTYSHTGLSLSIVIPISSLNVVTVFTLYALSVNFPAAISNDNAPSPVNPDNVNVYSTPFVIVFGLLNVFVDGVTVVFPTFTVM